LIKLAGGEGVIRQADGEIELTHDVTEDRGQPLQPWDRYQPIRLGLSGHGLGLPVVFCSGCGVRRAGSLYRQARFARRGVDDVRVEG
jgi:hypothetical protein